MGNDKANEHNDEDRQKRPSLRANAASNYATLAVNMLVVFLLTPFVIRHLDLVGYGIWVLVQSLVGYCGLLDLGVSSAVTRYVARYAGQGDYHSLNRSIGAALGLFSGMALVVAAAALALAGVLAGFFNIEPANIADFKHVVWILGMGTALAFPGRVFGATLTAHERFVPANCANIAVILLRAGLTVLLLKADMALMGVAWANLAGAGGGLVAKYILCRRYVPYMRIQLGSVHWKALRSLLTFGAAATVVRVADLLRFQLDSFVIGKWVGLAELAVYAIAARIIFNWIFPLIISGTRVLDPRFAALDSIGQRQKLRELFMRSLAASSTMAFGISMLAFLFGGSFIVRWVGSEFAGAAPVLWILLAACVCDLAQNPGIGLMRALNKHHLYALVTIIEGVANVVLSIALAYRYGIVGVALGTAIPMAVVKLVVQPIYVSRLVGIPLATYLRPFLLPGLVAAVTVTIGWQIGLVTDVTTVSYPLLAAKALAGGLIFLGIIWVLAPRRVAMLLGRGRS